MMRVRIRGDRPWMKPRAVAKGMATGSRTVSTSSLVRKRYLLR